MSGDDSSPSIRALVRETVFRPFPLACPSGALYIERMFLLRLCINQPIHYLRLYRSLYSNKPANPSQYTLSLIPDVLPPLSATPLLISGASRVFLTKMQSPSEISPVTLLTEPGNDTPYPCSSSTSDTSPKKSLRQPLWSLVWMCSSPFGGSQSTPLKVLGIPTNSASAPPTV